MKTMTMETEQQALQHSKAYFAAIFTLCFVSSVLGGSVSTLMSVYLPVVLKDLQAGIKPDQVDSVSGLINALFIYGWAVGGFSWGLISDRIGRKKALLSSIVCYGVFTVLTGQMTQWTGVMACRFLSGFGVGGEMVIAMTLISEVWPKKGKAIMIGILSIAFPIGIFGAGAINVITPLWRQGFLIGAIPLVMALIGIFVVSESAEWTQHQNQHQQKQSIFSAENRGELIAGSLLFGTMLIGLWAIFSWLPSWIQSLTVGDAAKERGLSMMFMGMGGLTGGFFSGWLVNVLGLRRSMVLCFAVCTVLSFVLFKTNNSISGLVFIEIAVLALFFGISQGVLSSYIPQLFQTGVRATATGFCFNIGRLFTATAVLFIGVLVTTLGGYGNAIFLFSLVFVLGFIVVILMPKKPQPIN